MNASTRVALLTAVAAVAVTVLSACSSGTLPGLYRLDIQQGNVVTEEMLDQLEPGMDRRKVQFILGTPLLTDPFNTDRWDYLYSLETGSGDRVQRHVSLVFDNDRLVRVEGDIRSGGTAEATATRTDMVVTVPAERRKEGIFAFLVPDFLSKDSGKRSAPAVAAGGAATVAAVSRSDGGTADAAGEPERISEEDRAGLEKLFGDFGRLDVDAGEPTAGAGPAPRQEEESR